MKDATGIKYKLEAKDSEIKDFRKILKAKQDELSEMQVCKLFQLSLRNRLIFAG